MNRYLVKQHRQVVKQLIESSKKSMVQIKKKSNFRVKLNEIENLQFYYEDILRFSYISERGVQKIDPSHLDNMLAICQDTSQLQLVVDAYFNFVGHHTTFLQSQVDALLLKAIHLDALHLIMDILRHHNYLMYYPSNQVMEAVTNHIKITNNLDQAKEVIQILKHKLLIKKTDKTIDNLLHILVHNNEEKDYLSFFKIIKDQNIKISKELAQSIIQYTLKFLQDKKFGQLHQYILGQLYDQYQNDFEVVLGICVIYLKYPNKEQFSKFFKKLETLTSDKTESQYNEEFRNSLLDHCIAKCHRKIIQSQNVKSLFGLITKNIQIDNQEKEDNFQKRLQMEFYEKLQQQEIDNKKKQQEQKQKLMQMKKEKRLQKKEQRRQEVIEKEQKLGEEKQELQEEKQEEIKEEDKQELQKEKKKEEII